MPLLYNRRHLGVAMFLLALVHGLFSVIQFHALGDLHPLVSVFVSNPRIDSISQFPFQPLGLFALLIFFLMAATSHDFWLAHLTPPIWKSLHMAVYVAYGLVILHVALGSVQSTTNPALATLLALGMVGVFALHWVAGAREQPADAEDLTASGGWVELCSVDSIPEERARIFSVAGERIAVFRYDGKISAISNLCQHQNGPLGEGRILNGCVTCPWHGFQYRPEDGRAPEPFTERLPTFGVQVRNGVVFVDPKPNPPGTHVEPARVTGRSESEGSGHGE
jgi:nitrite reductase/ring-hydroxylating ferredoxin subunit